MNTKINIAIDGHSSCGKSTLARELAKSLGYLFIDSGAMYRAVTLYFLDNQIDLQVPSAVSSALAKINLEMSAPQGKFSISLNGTEVTQKIISIAVSSKVSEVAALSAVRTKLVEIQKKIGMDKGVVMDGRDIGTVVYPDAELKLFVTANIEVRTQRRYLELQSKGMPAPYETVKENLLHRDHIDSTRADSPLRKAKEAILIDNSYMDRAEQLFIAQKLVSELITA